jgi:hypothetical protein
MTEKSDILHSPEVGNCRSSGLRKGFERGGISLRRVVTLLEDRIKK